MLQGGYTNSNKRDIILLLFSSIVGIQASFIMIVVVAKNRLKQPNLICKNRKTM
jgi:hypothetical protein